MGGLGPEAGAHFYLNLVRQTSAEFDQQHPEVVLYSNPKIPDRTVAIELGDDISPVITETASKIRKMGADFLVIPCNTAHVFAHKDRIERVAEIELLSIIDVTVQHIVDTIPNASTVGLLASAGTVKSGIYRTALESERIELVVPNSSGQSDVSRAIAMVKAGALGDTAKSAAVKNLLGTQIDSLAREGCDCVILGCTEIPLAIRPDDNESVPLIDTIEVLASATLDKARSH